VCKRFLVVKDTEMAKACTIYDRDGKCIFNISQSKSQDLGKEATIHLFVFVVYLSI